MTACPDQQLFIKGKQNLWKVSLEDLNFYEAETVDLFTFTIETLNPLSVNPTKWPNGLKTIRQECIWPFCEVGA